MSFQVLLNTLHDAGLYLSADELADVLWLAQRMGRGSAVLDPLSDTSNSATQPYSDSENALHPPPEQPAAIQPEHSSDDSPSPQTLPPTQALHPDTQRSGIQNKAKLLRVPAVPLLPESLNIGRVLRILHQYVPSRTRLALDEVRTVQYIAEHGVWCPQTQGQPERRFELGLIFDAGASMPFWQPTLDAFYQLLMRQGAFRMVRVWHASSDDVPIELRTGMLAKQGRRCHPEELLLPSGRRLLLVVSDCTAPAWHSTAQGSFPDLLHLWGQQQPVALVQMLPERLWSGTALGYAASTYFRATTVASPNRCLHSDRVLWRRRRERSETHDKTFNLPVVNLHAASLQQWAAVVIGHGEYWVRGVNFNLGHMAEMIQQMDSRAAEKAAPMDVEALLQQFRSYASPTAQQLAVYLAAAPLTLPIMRMVQQLMLPESRLVHLAEIFFSGLLRRLSSDKDVPVAQVEYDFYDNLRARLLDYSEAADIERIVQAVLSRYVTNHLGQPLDLRVLLEDAEAGDFYSLNPQGQHFADISAEVLRRLGGDYLRVARRLVGEIDAGIVTSDSDTITGKAENVFLAPSRNPYFTGRDTLLAQLAAGLPQQPMAVCGLGGLGKTQTLTEYAYRQQAAYSAVLWLEASSAESLETGILGLAESLGLPSHGLDAATIRVQVKQWLQTHSGWLLVLDNVDRLDAVRALVSEFRAFGHILLSTRLSETRPVAATLNLEEMSPAEGMAFLAQRTGLPADESAMQLVELLEGLPLALEQAAAYVLETGSGSYERYIQLYETHGLRLLERRGERLHPTDHPDPVAVTWLMSVENINATPLAGEILQYCAFLHGGGIVQEVFAEFDPLDYDDAMAVILRYSLLRRDDKAELLFMHGLVQVVLRGQLAEEAQRSVVERVVELLVKACPTDSADYAAWSTRFAKWLLNARVIEEWIGRWTLQSEAIGDLLNQMGYYLSEIGDYAQALPLFQQALAIRQQVLGQQHPDYAASLNNLAALYDSQGDYAQALPLYQQALAIREQVLGQPHPDYATSLNNLAALYKAQGDYAQALPLFQQALAIREQVLGQQHPDYATSLNNLAELYRTQGDYAQALPLFQQALKINEQVLGQQHPDYALSLNNLAELHRTQGDYAQALPLFQQALKINEQVLGQQHPDYAGSLNNLAALYKAQGDYAQALPLYQQALAIREQVLGQQHPDYANSLNNLAGLYTTQGDYAQALPLYQQALAIREQVLGQQHPDYANSLNNLAELHRTQGDYAQALPLFQQALAICTQALGTQHPHTQIVQNNYECCQAAVRDSEP